MERMKKETFKKILGELGFIPEELEGAGMTIEFEGLSILIPDDNFQDNDCVTLMAINVAGLEKNEKDEIYRALIELCGRLKFVQPQIMFDSQIWLCYQHYISEGKEITIDLIEHMIRVLISSALNLNNILKEMKYERL